jgi:hypothetical protein
MIFQAETPFIGKTNKDRLKNLKEFYNLKTEQDVITLALRVLEIGYTHSSPIFYYDNGDFYEVQIG